jgi:hypothetical protein
MPTVVENNRIIWTRSSLIADNTRYADFTLADGDTITIENIDSVVVTVIPPIVVPGPSTTVYDLIMQGLFVDLSLYDSAVPGQRGDQYTTAFQDGVSCGEAWRSMAYPLSQVPEELRFLSLVSFSYEMVSWNPTPMPSTPYVTIGRPTRIEVAIQPEIFRSLYYEGDVIRVFLLDSVSRYFGASYPGGYSFSRGEEHDAGFVFFNYEDIIPDGPPVHLPALPSKFCIIAPPVVPGESCLIAPPTVPGTEDVLD